MSNVRRHIPERTCVGCRRTKPKRDMVRLVHMADNGVVVDEKGRAAGRGAYLCRERKCWGLALGTGKRDRLSHALRAGITPENRAILSDYVKTLPSSEAIAERGIE